MQWKISKNKKKNFQNNEIPKDDYQMLMILSYSEYAHTTHMAKLIFKAYKKN